MLTTQTSWSHEQGLAYECAKECITHLMALCSEQLAAEEDKPEPDAEHLQALEQDLRALVREQRELGLLDAERIARIRREYGAWLAAQLGGRALNADARARMAACYPALAAGVVG